ncbi:PREDICTED: ubiquitin-related modifier 1 isoform X2 [Ceratosolen solmsi marchali]|uniref:Ubiquitin-related modifier 1 homolog n=1 Tax=Ceratosolen solmsi marchali TaxID=326594 RepID=A0AAJ6YCF6_9HYME|nr:PREDICTED: ubiquitin-related modifier 1 isoform X2 [Ceratosolen solmsi marchali]
MTECSDKLPLTIEFGGGVELLLYDKIKKHNISLPGDRIWTLGDLVLWLKNNMIKERCELFIQNDTVRPGILVLVNDADWELLGQTKYVLQPHDSVLFISTLHGG